jgi:tetratricopeptide (TPR) repeat protein
MTSTRSRWIALGSVILAVVLGIVVYRVFFRGPAVIDPPAPDLSSVDQEVRQAIEEATAEVKRTPRSAEAWGRLGMVLTSHIFGDEALACFAQAERLDPSNPRWPYHQGLIYLAHDPPSALAKIQRTVELCGDDVDGPRLRLAELYVWLGQPDEAREQFQFLLQRQPGHPRAHLGLARLDFQAGKLTSSREHLQHALEHPLTRRSALALSAELHQRQGDDRSAQQERARMVGLPDEPDWPDDYVAEAARLKVGESARVSMAGKLLDHNRTAEAIPLLEQIIQDYPHSAQGWMLLGWAQMRQGQLPAAEQALRTALERDPGLARAWLYRGMIRFHLKNRREAISCFREAIKHKPTYLEAYFNLGQCLKMEGQDNEAIAAFRDALRCQPLSAPAHANLGELLLKQGNKDEAVLHLQQAVDLDPNDTASRERLAKARSPK